MANQSIVKVFTQKPGERRRRYIDYSCWLAEDEILVEFQIIIFPLTEEAPVVVSAGYPDAEQKRMMMFISGGVANTNYTLQMFVRTDAGQIKQDNIGLRVVN